MDFRISDTFTDSLAKLTGDEQKLVKTTAFDLQMNPVVAQKFKEFKIQHANSSAKLTPVIIDTLSLPFLDDFSKDGVYPDTALWINNSVLRCTRPRWP